MNNYNTKVCNRCNKKYPATHEYFHKHKGFKDGLRQPCIQCRSVKKERKRYFIYVSGKKVEAIKCRGCQTLYEASTDNYRKNKRGYLGLSARCKGCDRKYRIENKARIAEAKRDWEARNRERVRKRKREYAEKHREYLRKYRAEYYQKNKNGKIRDYRSENREYILHQRSEYRERNRHLLRDKAKRYYREKGDEIKARKKEYVKSNLDKYRRYAQERKARLAGLDTGLSEEDWESCKKDFSHKCAYCGKEKKLSQEHFIPLSKGGEYTHNNIIPACKSCNSSKHNKSFFEWFPEQPFYSKQREERILRYLEYSKNTEKT